MAKVLVLSPVTFREAYAFVDRYHRHSVPPRGHKFSIGVRREGELVGVVMVGRPVARAYDTGFVAEVNRTCVMNGVPSANSMLYGAAWRACRAMGYRSAITYTQEGESGASLHGAGWVRLADRPARGTWAESSVKLKKIRDPIGDGGVARVLWGVGDIVLEFRNNGTKQKKGKGSLEL